MTETFLDNDGITIAFRHWPAPGLARGSVVIAHGASEHGGRYAPFAERLTSAGYDVYAPDHRGHGETGASHGAGLLGPRGYDGIVDDVDHLVRQAHGPVVLFGHSLGSVIALRYAETYGDALAGLALSGPLGTLPGAAEMLAGLQGAVDNGMADQPMDALGPFNEPFEPARTPFDWLSRDEREVDKYVADPFCGAGNPLTYGYMHASVQAVLDELDGLDRLPRDLPVLLMAGERDPVSNGAAAVRELAERLRYTGLTVTEHYYPDARHEVLNETNRDEVETDALAWIEGVSG